EAAWRGRNILAAPWLEPITPFAACKGQRIDAVIALPDCLPRDARDAAMARARDFIGLVKPGGIIALAAEIAVDRFDSKLWLPVGWLQNGTFGRRVGATPLADFDERLSALTLDRTQIAGGASYPHLMLDENGALITSGTWFGRV